MLNATLTEEMITILKNLKNSKFISYECGKNICSTYGNLRINTDTCSIELRNIEKPMPFFDTTEDIASFECKNTDSNQQFEPYCIVKPKKIEIGEFIAGIEIINDYVNVNDGEHEFSFDQAIIIKTENTTTMFSRDVWFSEIITISENDNYDSLFSISEAVDSFSNYGEYRVDIKRTKYSL